jgi:hypothetical protein
MMASKDGNGEFVAYAQVFCLFFVIIIRSLGRRYCASNNASN